MSGRLQGKLIVVTGAARGQGEAEAATLAVEGAIVIACDLSDALASSGGPAGPPLGTGVHPHPLDVADAGSWEALRDFISESHGRVGGLINNAGVTSRVRLPGVELEDWNRVLAINLTGPMLGIKTLLPLMRDGASVVNVGSIAGGRWSGHARASA